MLLKVGEDEALAKNNDLWEKSNRGSRKMVVGESRRLAAGCGIQQRRCECCGRGWEEGMT